MSDYRCEHGGYAMGRDCEICQAERQARDKKEEDAKQWLRKWMKSHPDHAVTLKIDEANIL